MTRTLTIAVIVTLLVGTREARPGERGEWPSYHGSDRTNMSRDAQLLKTWPKDGPQLIWTVTGIGRGYSSAAVAGSRIYTAGMIGKDTHVIALSMDGKTVWRRRAGVSWQATDQQRWAVPYSGARATPTVDDGTVYFLSELGALKAFDAAKGDERWSLDVAATFEADRPKYGYSESVLIDGDRLFCCPGGKNAYMVALDKRNGALLWANAEITDPIGYSSSVLAEIGDSRQLISLTSARIFAVNPADGKLLWQHPFANERGNNATDVIVHDGLVFASSGYGKGSVLLRPERTNDGAFTVKVVWETELLDNHHGGVVLVDRYLYGAGSKAKGWFCLEFLGGRKCWQSPGKGSLTYADGRLYCLDEKGDMSLIQVDSKQWVEVGRFTVPRGGEGAYWAHPVVCGGRLYVRHSDHLYAYDIRE